MIQEVVGAAVEDGGMAEKKKSFFEKGGFLSCACFIVVCPFDLEVSFVVHEQILWLEIAVRHAEPMDVLEGRDDAAATKIHTPGFTFQEKRKKLAASPAKNWESTENERRACEQGTYIHTQITQANANKQSIDRTNLKNEDAPSNGVTWRG